VKREDEGGPEGVRLDKWLWAARFYKTRGLAAEAIEGGKVELNGDRAKRGKNLKLGDELRIRVSPFEYHVIVRGVSGRRGPASVAQELYEETAEGKAQRELHAERLRSAPPPIFQEKGRPTKRDRRALRRLKDGE
jgi:ribosome-associated heat shock protein Hsp15